MYQKANECAKWVLWCIATSEYKSFRHFPYYDVFISYILIPTHFKDWEPFKCNRKFCYLCSCSTVKSCIIPSMGAHFAALHCKELWFVSLIGRTMHFHFLSPLWSLLVGWIFRANFTRDFFMCKSQWDKEQYFYDTDDLYLEISLCLNFAITAQKNFQ